MSRWQFTRFVRRSRPNWTVIPVTAGVVFAWPSRACAWLFVWTHEDWDRNTTALVMGCGPVALMFHERKGWWT